MHWESWLEKVNTSSDGTDLERSNIDDSLLLDTDKPKKKVPLRMDDDKGGAFDDSGFYNKSEVNKILGAIAGAVGGAARAVGAAGKVVGEAVGRGAQGLGEAASAGGQSGGESASETLSTTSDEVGNFLDDVKDESNSHLETIKSWETWLEKGRWDNPKHDTNTQKEFEAFEKLSKLPKNEVTELGDAIDEAIEGVKSGKLKKNNAIETSHKEGEKKEEWNGKFDNSTTRDGVKDEDDKAVSEEKPLEELTDGKLEEVEKLKSWELWLEKYDKDPNPEETDPEKIMQNAEVVGRKDNPMIKDMYKSWLEKMQGAGDARYGNQHLTGMEQHPVDDDESIDLSAESDKNNEKQEKTEDKEGKDNKPYKALS